MDYRRVMPSYALLALLILIGCGGSSKYMSYSDYQSVEIGTPVASLQVHQGQPYQVNDQENGLQEYVYVERIPLGGNREHFREYSFLVDENNLVVGKRVQDEFSPVVDIEEDH